MVLTKAPCFLSFPAFKEYFVIILEIHSKIYCKYLILKYIK